MSRNPLSKKTKKQHDGPTMAEQADRHQLYELAVQCSESELDFVDATFKSIRKQRAKILREDFCGTANVCCDWVKRRKSNHAIGVDIDPEVLEWGQKNNLSKLAEAERQRIQLFNENVLTVKTEPAEIISAMNFSYWLFKSRKELKQYFQNVHSALADNGILFLDAYGGYESFKEIKEKTKHKKHKFTYIWEQEKYDPISGELTCHIHFKFPDGSKLKKAFSYSWRLWTLPEIRELLSETGFSNITIYWQGFDEDGDPDGDFKPTREGEADASWICYISAEK
jgi:SAM-dependent methyltransferase